MENVKRPHINISAPNLINICIDQQVSGEISGRLYHCYSEKPVEFQNIIELLRETERLFDSIGFPQASTKTRSFMNQPSSQEIRVQKPEKKAAQEEIAKYTGERGTFITSVRFRQNSTWQGELYWAEKERIQKFSNILEFIRLIDLDLSEKE